MPALKLYASPTSPFARMVRVQMIEAGLDETAEIVSVSGSPLDPGTHPLGQNPLGKIPTLEREDGAALYDSRVICQYLDDRSGGMFYPKPPRRWETLTLQATGHGIAEAALMMLYEIRLRPEGERSQAWVEGQWTKVARALDTLESRWMSHLHGPLDMGQIAVGCALGYLDLRHGERGWRTGRPALDAWYARFSERPSMQATRPPD